MNVEFLVITNTTKKEFQLLKFLLVKNKIVEVEQVLNGPVGNKVILVSNLFPSEEIQLKALAPNVDKVILPKMSEATKKKISDAHSNPIQFIDSVKQEIIRVLKEKNMPLHANQIARLLNNKYDVNTIVKYACILNYEKKIVIDHVDSRSRAYYMCKKVMTKGRRQ